LITINAPNDVIEFSHNEFANLQALQAAAHQVGSNVVITADANDAVTLHDVTLSQLHFNASHFLLV
jgi:hypothetical protein